MRSTFLSGTRKWLGALMALGCTLATAQEPFPSRPLTLINPWAAGSSTDVMARTLAEEFRKQLGRDRVKTMAGGFSQLGLVEMTRKRTRESLAHMLCEPCPTCEGKGIVKTPRSVAYDILREILREARQFTPREFRVVASPKVIELLLDEESQHLAGLSEFIGKPVSLQSEAGMAQEQYDIVLL